MTARITSAKANDIYAWQDASGLYRVKFDADRDDKSQGQESMPVRLAKPYGGDVYGFHFPLIQGTEVAIAFHEGDPDRPYIAHALHDSRHVDHVTEKNSTRNVIRTPTNNKLRMEDKRGEEHIKLSTEYGGKTQLNLGHNVDASRVLRGEGAELRTDKWVTALRKLRHRPADGIIWVTSALDGLPGAEDGSLSALTPDAMDQLSHALSRRYDALGWQLPLYVWSLHPHTGRQNGRVTQPVGCLLPAKCTPQALAGQLAGLIPQLTAQGIQQVCTEPQHHFLLSLADLLTRKPETVAEPLSVLLNPYRPLPLAGVVFSPPSAGAGRSVAHHWGKDNRWDAIPASAQALPAGLRPRKPGICWTQMAGVSVAALMVLWGVSMAVSFVANRHLVVTAQEQVQQSVAEKQPLSTRLHALSELQKTLARLQYRGQHGVPWYARGGLSQNDALLAALFPRYGESALPLLRDAAAEHLTQQLHAFVQLPPDSPLRERMAKPVYDRLRLYLMLSRPEKMDAAWFSATLMRYWSQRAGVANGLWQGSGPALYAFYATSLASHPQWRLHADDMLVSQTRTLLVRQMGVRNSESTLYQKMLAQVANQYADMRLTDMTGDTDAASLFRTDEVVPGMFTRQAWEEAVQPAIDKVVNERREEMDWVLSDSRQPATQQTSPEALKQRLTARYFADFSTAWLDFLNSLRWQRAVTLSDAIDQLTLMADVRQSPLVALMNTLNVQGRSLLSRGANHLWLDVQWYLHQALLKSGLEHEA